VTLVPKTSEGGEGEIRKFYREGKGEKRVFFPKGKKRELKGPK